MKKLILLFVSLVSLVWASLLRTPASIPDGADSNVVLPSPTSEVIMLLPAEQPIFDAVRMQQATVLGVEPSSISLVEISSIDWSDSCLGLGGPAESCLQVVTPGYRVLVSQAGVTYEFHTDVFAEQIRQVP